ncbi:MAG: 4-hydroxy-3-methylbut-2-enyl diphosphate reductase [Lachnospiraceae bacterium]|nr:4-hydroxy-3-methylbut-2-enyl diphosphate reductase [Lachnospiraceae bacterium]
MEIKVAKSAGFCFGVQRAVDKVYAEIAKNASLPIYTYGPIIHNEEVVSDLKEKGVHIINTQEELESVKEGTVIIRSHGVGRIQEEQIRSMGLNLIDMTCPFVKKIHRIADEQSRAGKVILIAGNPSHPEVQGIMGWCSGPVFTVETPQELDQIAMTLEKEACLVAQTTFNDKKFKILVDLIQKKRYDIYCARTICSATRERQEEAAQISSWADGMIVIGSSNSSNTQKLYEICKKECNSTHYIQTAEDLNQQWFLAAEKVGVTAGASTPNNIIEEVLRNVRGF